ncbi:hypothetical protein MKW92_032611 [Papaver armeniacum]|nr:hypothetical protein MKW92_032611 [Papaver armeniacum]
MTNNEVVDKQIRPLDLGNFPPWNVIVTLAGGETCQINIPHPLGNPVIGLPLGLDVPQVIAGRYQALLRMVQGMRDVITHLVRDLARCQQDAACFWHDAARSRQDAARFWQDANRFYCELEELKSTMGDNVVVSQDLMAPVSPSKKRKLNTEESGLSETQVVIIEKPEHLPPTKSNDRPSIPCLLVQESVIEENMDESDDLPQREDVSTSTALVCSDLQTEKVESVAGVVPVGESVDASVTCTSANCLTVDSTTLTILNPVDITPPLIASTNVSGQVEDEGFEIEYVENLKLDDLPLTSVKNSQGEDGSTDVQTGKVASVAGVMLIEEPVDPTMTSTSANCLTVDCTTLTISTPPLEESTSVSSQVGDEWFEYVENFKIPKVYADLYKKIFSKYGHMATKKVIKSNDAVLIVCVTSLMKIASSMETVRGIDLSAALLEIWEGDIRDAETLQFNIKWLRQIFSRLKNSWNSSFRIDEEVENHEQVLDAEQVMYGCLNSRKDELESKLLEVKIDIRKSEAKISSEREAIRKKMAEKYIFLFEPLLGNLFS